MNGFAGNWVLVYLSNHRGEARHPFLRDSHADSRPIDSTVTYAEWSDCGDAVQVARRTLDARDSTQGLADANRKPIRSGLSCMISGSCGSAIPRFGCGPSGTGCGQLVRPRHVS